MLVVHILTFECCSNYLQHCVDEVSERHFTQRVVQDEQDPVPRHARRRYGSHIQQGV